MSLFKTVTKDSSVAALLRNDKWECLHLFVSASPCLPYSISPRLPSVSTVHR